MRLRRLSLERFGHFTDRDFDFGPCGDAPDFHIVHGPNEAGKTTTMEAVLRLFYGFPKVEPYAFKHQRANLRVSATLDIDGRDRRLSRLPGRGNPLVDDSGTALPDTAISAHLAGLTEVDYRKLLCLDDATIEQGGEEIARAEGDIGRLLFSAAAGVADLSAVLAEVQAEADAIWRKRASKTRVADLKRDLRAIDEDIRGRDVTASAWRGLKKAHTEALRTEADARTARDALRIRAARIAARARALPTLAKIDALDAALAPRAGYPDRLDTDPDSLLDLIAADGQARADIDRLDRTIADMTAALADIPRAPGLVALSDRLDALDTLRARDVTADQDLPRRRAEMDDAAGAMARAARDLGAPDGTDPATLVPGAADIAALEAARAALHDADATAATEARELAGLSERHAVARDAHDQAVAAAPRVRGIARILVQHDADRLAPAAARARQAIDSADTAARQALDALALGSARFAALPDCPDSAAGARDAADRHRALDQKIAAAGDAAADHRAAAAAAAAQAAALAAAAHLVTDAETDARVADRERCWQAHLADLTAASAAAFDTALRAVDAAQQSRLAQASELAQLQQFGIAEADASARAAAADSRLTGLRADRDAIAARIDRTATAIGLPTPMPPAGWADWVQRHAAAAEAIAHRDRTRDRHRGDLDAAKALHAALAPLLDRPAPDLDAALDAARACAEAERNAEAATTRTRDACDALAQDLARRTDSHAAARQAADAARTAWADRVARTLGPAIAVDTLLPTLDPLRALREQADRLAQAAHRVRSMDTDRAQFAAAIAALAAEHDLPQADSPAATFADLRARADAVRAAETRASTLQDGIAQARTDRATAQDARDRIDRQRAAMGRMFPPGTPVDTLDALRQTVATARQAIADRAARADLERALLGDLGLPDMASARADLQGATAVALAAEAETVATDLDTADTALTRATETRAAAAQALTQVTGDDSVAALSERRRTTELELEDAARDHLELALGHRLATEAIRRYRDAHRSAMMTATERGFAALTRGAYPRLAARTHGTDDTLLAVDAAGAAKRVADLSKGTRFQLYLALRAAAHEQLVAQGTCLPFFCDDIFETFDEDRTSAACRVMERIGRSGQAIYLTHHRHVVEIARSACDTPPTIHTL